MHYEASNPAHRHAITTHSKQAWLSINPASSRTCPLHRHKRL